MFKYILGAVFAVGVLSASAGFVTQALFTDTASVGSNTFTAGTVNISENVGSALITFSAMAPGDKVPAPITVSNAGTLQFRYAIKSTTTGSAPMAGQLDLTIKTGVTTCSNAAFTADGTIIYGPGDLGSAGGLNVVGDPTAGSNSGDRTLNASANEVLCFQASLPLSTNDTFQGLTATATLDFIAEQTANNA